MIGFIVLVVLVFGGGVSFVAFDNVRSSNAREVRQLRVQYTQALDTIDNVRQLAIDYRDVAPIFSDNVMEEIRRFDRKELGPHG